MSAVILRARADLRAHWRAWVGLALLLGMAGGAVTAAAAGARRTDSAYPRLLAATRAPDVEVFSDPTDPTSAFASIPFDQLARLPQVAEGAPAAFFSVVDPPDASLVAGPDDRLGRSVGRHKILAGRQPRPDRVDEMMASFTLASQHHLRVGDSFGLSLVAVGDSDPPPVTVELRVVGIEASAGEFPPQPGTGVNPVWATPAFFAAYGDKVKVYDATALGLRRGGRDAAAVEGEIQRLGGGRPVESYILNDQATNTEHSIHLQALALWVLAGLLALAALLVVAQLLARQANLESGDHPALRALGMSRGQLWALGMARAAVVSLIGAAVAVAVAALLSPLTPVGLARTAEPHPGFALDAAALGLGALAVVALVSAAAAWPAWRAAGANAGLQPSTVVGQGRPSAVAEALSRAAAPVPVTTGVRLALEPGRGRTAVPVRSTVTGAVIGIVALATALSFSASLDHLLATPRLYGVNWDGHVLALGGNNVAPALPAVTQDVDVADASSGYSGFPMVIGTVRVDGMAVTAERGTSLEPIPVEGRLPKEPDEVMLGGRTMAALHAHVGSTVRAIVADATPDPLPLRVVGRAVFPNLGDAIGLGKGVAMTPDGLRRMVATGAPPIDTILFRFRPGIKASRALAELQRRLGPLGSVTQAPDRPTDLVNFGRVQSFPLVLGGLLGVFAAATLAHLLVTSIRRRRRDLAVLKVLGLVPAQVRATVAWQATTLALVAVAVGLPLGVVAGRLVWRLFASQLGVRPEPALPLLALGLLALATLVVANLVAVLPARSAGRTHPALVLRSE